MTWLNEWPLIVLGQVAPAYHLPQERLNLPLIISPLSTPKRIKADDHIWGFWAMPWLT